MKYKKINPKEKTFYIFEVSSIKYAIYDSELDEPIYHGSWNMVEGIVKNIKSHSKNADILYYTKDKSGPLLLSPLWSHRGN